MIKEFRLIGSILFIHPFCDFLMGTEPLFRQGALNGKKPNANRME